MSQYEPPQYDPADSVFSLSATVVGNLELLCLTAGHLCVCLCVCLMLILFELFDFDFSSSAVRTALQEQTDVQRAQSCAPSGRSTHRSTLIQLFPAMFLFCCLYLLSSLV